MPISSTDVQNLINAQMGMFGTTSSYAGNISAQNRIGTPPVQFGGGSGAMDPRTPSEVGPGGQFGMGLAQAAASGMQTAPAIASGLAMFGYAPQVMDPFLGTLGAARAGWGSGAGQGMGMQAARGLGGGMAAMGGYMLAGSALNTITDQIIQGAQEQLTINTMLSMQATRRNLPLMGGIGPSGAAAIGGQIQGMANADPWTSVGELTGLMGSGLEGGMFRGAGSTGQFQAKFRQLVSEVRQVSDSLNVTLNEGLSVMRDVQGMGVYGTGSAAGMITTASGIGGGLGLTPGSMLGGAQSGSAMARRFGVHGGIGATLGLGMAGRLGAAALNESTAERIRELAGGAELEEAIPGLAGQLVGGAFALGSTRQGMDVLTAMVDPDTGQIDPSRAAGFASGAFSRKDIQRMARRADRSTKQAVKARHDSLLGDLVSLVGPEGMLGGYAQAEMMTRGLKPGENMDDVENVLIQKFGGLGEQQADLVRQLTQDGPGMRTAIQQRMQQEMAAQKAQVDLQKNYSLEGIKRRLVQAYVDPVLAPMRGLGADIVNWGTSAFQGAVDWLVGGLGGAGSAGEPAPVTAMSRRMMTDALSGTGPSFGAGDAQYGPAGSSGPTGFAKLVNDFAGMGAWNQRLSGAIGISDVVLPLAGMGMRAGGAALMRGGYGMASTGAANSLTGGVGWGAARRVGAGAAGMLAGGASWLAGRALGPIGLAVGAWDLGTNVIPGLLTATGVTPDYEGAVEGDEAEALWERYDQGIGLGQVGYSEDAQVPAGYQALRRGPKKSALGNAYDFWNSTPGSDATGRIGIVSNDYRREMATRARETLVDPMTVLKNAGVSPETVAHARSVYAQNRGAINRAVWGNEGPESRSRQLGYELRSRNVRLPQNMDSMKGGFALSLAVAPDIVGAQNRLIAQVGSSWKQPTGRRNARKMAGDSLKWYALFKSGGAEDFSDWLIGEMDRNTSVGGALLDYSRATDATGRTTALDKLAGTGAGPNMEVLTEGLGRGDKFLTQGVAYALEASRYGAQDSMRARADELRTNAGLIEGGLTNIRAPGKRTAAALAARAMADAVQSGDSAAVDAASRGISRIVLDAPAAEQAGLFAGTDPMLESIGGTTANLSAATRGRKGKGAVAALLRETIGSTDILNDAFWSEFRRGQGLNEQTRDDIARLVRQTGVPEDKVGAFVSNADKAARGDKAAQGELVSALATTSGVRTASAGGAAKTDASLSKFASAMEKLVPRLEEASARLGGGT